MLSLAGFSDFARHYFRNLGWCLFLELLRCFSSPGSPRIPMYSLCDTFRWVSPFGNLRIKANLPAPRSLSQAITSFVAYHCQGIHHMLLVTWLYNFDICLRRKVSQETVYCQVLHLTRYAVTRIFIACPDFRPDENFNSSLLNIKAVFQPRWNIRFDAIKNVTRGTVCTKPLRMCSFL